MKQSEAVVEIPIGKLHRHPDNPRKASAYKKGALASLSAVLDEHGSEPCVVRKIDDGYQILSGHRRAAALEIAGAKTVPCVIREKDEVEALTFMLSVNDQHEPTDPFLEAVAIGKLLNKHGATLDGVSKKLGWSVRRVARRRELLNLCPTILQEYQSEGSDIAHWPVTWLESIVQLDPVVQERWFKEQNPKWMKTLGEIEDSISGYLRHLAKAPWDLNDVTLVPKAGPCSTCPKQSAGAPGLFGENATPDKLNKAVCRDAICWKSKLDKFAAQKVAQELSDSEELVALKDYASSTPGVSLERASARLPKGKSALQSHMWKKCAKDDPGAKQGILVTGASAGRKVWFKPLGHATSSGHVQEKPGKLLKDDLKAAELAFERTKATALLQDAAETLLKRKAAPGAEDVLALMAITGLQQSAWNRMEKDHAEAVEALKKGTFAEFVWPSVAAAVHECGYRTFNAQPEDLRALARIALRTVLDATEVTAIEEKLDAGFPLPNQLADLRKRVAEMKGAKKKSKSAAEHDTAGDGPDPGAAPTSGVCRQCKCTETTPCVDEHNEPCAWADAALTLCTACDIKNEEEFEKAAAAAAAPKKTRKAKGAKAQPIDGAPGDAFDDGSVE
jgi:ParB/RepB/Spo0J family partition protein